MSFNFVGVTFAEQKVAPSDDAIVRKNLLTDGILHGCEFSYSGSTLTMAAGQLMIAGRQIRHPAAQNWAVVDATTGYARLLLTIDLTRTSTREVFDQVIDTVEYASSVDGFAPLEQADINEAGTRYQVVACVVSLGTGGISGIAEILGKSTILGGEHDHDDIYLKKSGGKMTGALTMEGPLVLTKGKNYFESIDDVPEDLPVGTLFYVEVVMNDG